MRITKNTESRNRALIGTAAGAAFALAAAAGVVRADTVVTEEWLFGSGGLFHQHPEWYPCVTISSGNVLMTIPQPFIDALKRANIPLQDVVRQILGGKYDGSCVDPDISDNPLRGSPGQPLYVTIYPQALSVMPVENDPSTVSRKYTTTDKGFQVVLQDFRQEQELCKVPPMPEELPPAVPQQESPKLPGIDL
jgi:hypothetical protein